MRRTKCISIVLIIIALISLFSGCKKRVAVPDIMEMNEEKAVETIEEAGLVPLVEYEYNDMDEKGKIIRVSPRVGNSAEAGDEVIIYISKGPEKIVAKNAGRRTIAKNLDFELPYVDKDVLYIKCFDVAFKEGMTWEKSDEEGIAITEASLTTDFKKTIPVKIKHDKEYTAPLETQNFVIAIPMEEIGDKLPETISVRLNLIKDELPEGEVEEVVPEEMKLEKGGIKVDFTIEW